MRLLLTMAAGALAVVATSAQSQQAPPPASPPLYPVARQTVDNGEKYLALPKLDPNLSVASLDLPARTPVREVMNSIVRATGLILSYDDAVSVVFTSSATKLSNATAEDALQRVLGGTGLAFKATGVKSAIIYPDTPEGREKYVESVRTFVLVKADPATLALLLNHTFTTTTVRGQSRPVIVPSRESRFISVRANAPTMAEIAKVIAANDK